jgi:Protein of unknown function (DUF3295)
MTGLPQMDASLPCFYLSGPMMLPKPPPTPCSTPIKLGSQTSFDCHRGSDASTLLQIAAGILTIAQPNSNVFPGRDNSRTLKSVNQSTHDVEDEFYSEREGTSTLGRAVEDHESSNSALSSKIESWGSFGSDDVIEDESKSAMTDEDDWADREDIVNSLQSSSNITQQSLLTLGLLQQAVVQVGATPGSGQVSRRSQAALHNSPCVVGSPEYNEEIEATMLGVSIPSSKPVGTSTNYVASSPRTIRRQMFQAEFTESLRRKLFWERDEKRTTVNAVLKRKDYSDTQDALKTSSWDQYVRSPSEYNQSGW